MLAAWDNKLDAALLTASSQIATLPASNVQHAHLARKWHTAAGVKSATLLADLGSSLSIGILALLGTNLTSAATLRLRGSDADPTGVAGEKYDSTTIAAGVNNEFRDIYKWFTAAAARYWLLNLDDATVASNLQVGRIFLGPKWTPSYGQSWDWAPEVSDSSVVEHSIGGQIYADELPKKRRLSFALDYLAESEAMDSVHKLRRACGVTRGVLVIPMESGSYISHQALWGRLVETRSPIFHRRANLWSAKFEQEEIL